MRVPTACRDAILLVGSLAAGCGGEDTHTHDGNDFSSRAECEEHYASEGRDPGEIEELCEDLE